jgi:hypothetical protein
MAGVVQAALLGKTTQYNLPDTIFKNVFSGSANAFFTMINDGGVNSSNLGDSDWVNLETFAPNLYVYANVTSGTMSGGTFNSWLSTSSQRTWWLYRSGEGTSLATVNYRISTESDGSVIIHDEDVDFTAIVNSF